MIPVMKIIKLVILFSLLLFTSSFAISNPIQVKSMVQSLLKDNGINDSALTPLVVAGIGEENRDFILVPILSNDKVTTFYRDDPQRSWVVKLASGISMRGIKKELLYKESVLEFLKSKKINAQTAKLISLGSLSLFGVSGAGWYVPISGSYYLVTFRGKIINEDDFLRYYSHKKELINSVKLELTSPKDIRPPFEVE